MEALRDALGAAVIWGALAWVSSVVWYAAQDWTQNVAVLTDFPFLAGLGAVFLFLTLAEAALSLGKTWFDRSSHRSR